ncbi:CGNR zinc finger domain-containing protein [Prauserella muralis]|uniref:CGNR zinc finger domain-containing protein n=1 Tax=Prauserella muralis TaxID=588067 RepID=UPI000DD3B074|nr:CGNR zinc finger domain-containing protein [Prauserella muralis]TWE28743.1 CGNR zinc finger protein [Prauserella muralis]
MDIANLVDGGAPLLGEPLPIELGNTAYAARGRPLDGLLSREHLAAWLRDTRPRLALPLADTDITGVAEDDLATARHLRDAIRSLAAAAVDQRQADRDAVAVLNRTAGRTPRWRELRTDPEPHTVVCTDGRPVAAVLAELAEDAVTLFTGPMHHELRACQGPGCRLFFVRDNPRRAWCSAGCGNRARAARHYARTQRSA